MSPVATRTALPADRRAGVMPRQDTLVRLTSSVCFGHGKEKAGQMVGHTRILVEKASGHPFVW